MEAIRNAGCLCCRRYAYKVRAECHHLTSGGVRISHDDTIGLCPWHHQGNRVMGLNRKEAQAQIGPSLKLSSKKFHATFGSDEQLLDEQNKLLGLAPVVRAVLPGKLMRPDRKHSKGNTERPSKYCARRI